jgi:maltose O-acetyltransferase
MELPQFQSTFAPGAAEARRAPRLSSRTWQVLNLVQRSALWPEAWRRRLLKWAGCRLAPGATIREDVYIAGPGLRMAAGTYVNVGCLLDVNAPIHIGEGARLGPRVMILTGTHEYEPSVMRRSVHGRDLRLPVTIARGCWIGMGAIIMPGVTVAEGCVIGAGAVVLNSTEPNGLYVGNPARRVRDLPVA